MSNEQKLLHVALEAINSLMKGAERDSDNEWGRICMPTNSAMSKGADAAAAIRQALATTEPEPTGMPEVKPWDHPEPQTMRWSDIEIRWIQTYGEQCWKAGYKHGAWGDKPAVNQQLTTGPVDELPEPHAVIAGKLGTHCSFNSNELRKGDPIYTAAQMRAAMAQVGDINVVESFTNDTKDAKRYRWLRDIAPTLGNRAPHVTQYPGQSFDKTTYLDATKVGLDAAIDAAMANGVK